MDRPIFYIASVLIVTKGYDCPVYYVTTNAGVSWFVGYTSLPDMVKKWLECHNDTAHAFTVLSESGLSVIVVSDVAVI